MSAKVMPRYATRMTQSSILQPRLKKKQTEKEKKKKHKSAQYSIRNKNGIHLLKVRFYWQIIVIGSGVKIGDSAKNFRLRFVHIF